MARSTLKLFPTLVICCIMLWLLLSETSGQVTFSRDWGAGGGKRMIEAFTSPDFRPNSLKSANTICHILINHLKETITCDNDDPPSTSSLFSGKIK